MKKSNLYGLLFKCISNPLVFYMQSRLIMKDIEQKT